MRTNCRKVTPLGHRLLVDRIGPLGEGSIGATLKGFEVEIVGRKSRAKREGREQGVGPVAQAAKGVSLASLLALLEAASAAPSANYRLRSVGLVFDSVMKRTITGSRPATPGLLPRLAAAAHEEAPDLWMQEDFLPYDARLEVLVRWGSDLYRLLPGSLERPVATIDHLRLLAKVIDPVLVDRLGFGLEDAVELVLRRIDHVSTVLAPLWSPIEVEIGMSPFISAEELVAAGTLLDISSQVERCCNPDRARSALEYHSVRPNQLAFDLSSPVAQFGTTIAVRKGPLGLVPLPAGLLVETLDAMGSSLANKASQFDASVERRWRLLVRHLIGYMLQNSGHPISGPLKTAEGRSLHSLITYTPRQALVLDTVAGLRSSSLQEERRASIENLDSISPGVELSTRAGSLQDRRGCSGLWDPSYRSRRSGVRSKP